MTINKIDTATDLAAVESVIKASFSQTPDANIDDWFSIAEMTSTIEQNRGVGLKAVDNNVIVGIVHAQVETPINGREGKEKWVITNLAVLPDQTGKGIGSLLLKQIEAEARQYGAIKMYVHTNVGDDQVIRFYQKNGYEEAGTLKDYYYENSAVFLLKYLA